MMLGCITLLMSAAPSFASTIRLCTGAANGNYFAAGDMIKNMAGSAVDIAVVETGGTIDSLDRMLSLLKDDIKACDAMIGQPDGPVYISRSSPANVKKVRQVASLHREYLHVLCGKQSGVDDLGDLENNPEKYRIAIGEQGSGAWLIWQNLVSEDEDYGAVPVSNEGGIMALSSVSSGDTTCMLVPAGLRNGTPMEADSTFGDTVALVGANDKDFDDAIDIKGKSLYEYAKIPGEAYPKSFNYWSDVQTISWLAGVYVNTERFDQKTLSTFIQAATRAAGGIKAEFGQ
ncbi:TAXI family TRAP transporter solute-binding subunit [Rhizobium azibense]|nr:TAXI family TRAP transporter solute-binding subunit [Rhizobium azibense]